jgi:hypothetical protein
MTRTDYQTYYQLDWYDPASGSWFDFDTADDEAGVEALVARLTENARPYPCPTYRVSYSVTYEVRGDEVSAQGDDAYAATVAHREAHPTAEQTVLRKQLKGRADAARRGDA